jgi:hypothetical protein
MFLSTPHKKEVQESNLFLSRPTLYEFASVQRQSTKDNLKPNVAKVRHSYIYIYIHIVSLFFVRVCE